MDVTEKPIVVSLEPEYETEYLQLMYDYFTASERNSRASSIQEKKQVMAIKDKMAMLCNHNPQKLDMLKTIIKQVREAREKAIVISKSNAVASELFEDLTKDEEMKGVLLITPQLSIHEANQMIDRFNKVPESTVLILTDAVNTGLDVTAANHFVHYDYPARYPDILQRNNRITRQTSQHRDASIYYLMTSGKIDEFDYRECMQQNRTIKGAMSTV
jgi:ERCC4-related helicase